MESVGKTLKVHFIGIGGVSMSSLASYLIDIGFEVTGSDVTESVYTFMLRKKGCKIYLGHSKDNLPDAQVVVYNSAINKDNEELKYAREKKLFVLSRSELLKMISENFRSRVGVCGCNGKTTVTCMLAHIFKCAKKRFTAHIGGYDNKLTNSYVKGSEYFVSEVCEYNKNIGNFDATIGVCLNTGADHLECYANENELIDYYFNFLKRSETAVVWAEDRNLKNYEEENKVTFGYGDNCDYRIDGVTKKLGRYSFSLNFPSGKTERINLKVYGEHNVINAVAAAAAAGSAGISEKKIKRGLESFTGTMRRFEKIGYINGARVIADYAHHPEEIEASLKTALEICKGKLYVAFQPHTYSRTLALKEDFIRVLSGVERLVLYKTFPARESYMVGGSAYDLFCALDKKGVYLGDAEAMISYYKNKLKRSDVLLVLGAGDLYDLLKVRL